MEDKREKEAISKVSELKVLSSRFKSKDDRSKNKKKSRKEVAKEEQEKKRFELEEESLEKKVLSCVASLLDWNSLRPLVVSSSPASSGA